jgi:Holliday junction DNA helicase RuvA
MITFLRGELLEARPTRIVVGVNGIGYELDVSLNTFDHLPKKGGKVTILTHLYVTEDRMVLYGFVTEEERKLFKILIGISGIGPKLAMSILSGISPRNFRAAISRSSVSMLAAVHGIGKKKAERLIVELKDKIGALGALEPRAGEREVSAEDRAINDAALALISLGYTQSDAQKAVRAVLQRVGKVEDAERLIREALKVV